jgi:hypothetical protein
MAKMEEMWKENPQSTLQDIQEAQVEKAYQSVL